MAATGNGRYFIGHEITLFLYVLSRNIRNFIFSLLPIKRNYCGANEYTVLLLFIAIEIKVKLVFCIKNQT